MTNQPDLLRRPADALVAVLVAGALVVSPFFQGFEAVLLCIVVAALLAALFTILWRQHKTGISLPRHALPVALLFLWLWFAASLAWHPVVYVGVYNFWWLGTLPLAFALYWLWREHPLCRLVTRISAALLGAGLAGYAIFQFFALGLPARSVFIYINAHAALLNLILLPAAGFFLMTATRHRPDRRVQIALAILIALLAFAVALTRGRGSMLSLAAGLALLSVIGWRELPARVWAVPPALCLGAFAAANLAWQGGVLERHAELAALMNVGSMQARLLIWDGAWQLLREAPWFGSGLGMFALAYPAVRAPQDSSAGFLVHNDYLQLWLEAGLPALLLILAVAVAAFVLFARIQRSPRLGKPARLEAAGLFAGVLAVSLHTTVDFNFFVLPTLMLTGFMLARLLELGGKSAGVRIVIWRPARLLSANGWRALLVTVFFFPAVYFISVPASIHYTDKGIALAAQGQLLEAEAALLRASVFYPFADNIYISQADFYRYMLTLIPAEFGDDRRRLYDSAVALLDRAERLNAYRPLNHLVRGRLYAENPGFAGADAAGMATRSYERALALNPRFYPARVAWANLLIARDDTAAARALVEAGLNESYLVHEGIVPYFALAGRLRSDAGDAAGAEEMGERIKAAMAASGWRWTPLPEAAATLERPEKPVEKQEP
ncbi:MAG: O-antigen ligase family protein [Pseudomonadota bacterium]